MKTNNELKQPVTLLGGFFALLFMLGYMALVGFAMASGVAMALNIWGVL
jgi:hypothetical protein